MCHNINNYQSKYFQKYQFVLFLSYVTVKLNTHIHLCDSLLKSSLLFVVALSFRINLFCLNQNLLLFCVRSKEIEAAGLSGADPFKEVRIQSVVVEFLLSNVEVLFSDSFTSVGRFNAGMSNQKTNLFRYRCSHSSVNHSFSPVSPSSTFIKQAVMLVLFQNLVSCLYKQNFKA